MSVQDSAFSHLQHFHAPHSFARRENSFMCSYGSFAKTGGAGAGFLRDRSQQRKDRPRKLSTKERRLGVSLRKADLEFVDACKKGLVDTVGDILAHREGEARRPTSVDVIVRNGGRAQTNRLTTALHEAARGGHANVCALLIENGANPKMTLELGRVLTALHVCTSPQCAQVLLDGGAPSRYRQTLKSDSRIPDPAWYHRSQKRPLVAMVVDAFNEELMKKRGRRLAARERLQMIWSRLNGMIVGVRYIRRFQVAWKERFYDPDRGAFMKQVGAERFYLLASKLEREGSAVQIPDCNSDENNVRNKTSGPETNEVFAAGHGIAAVHAIRQQKKKIPDTQPSGIPDDFPKKKQVKCSTNSSLAEFCDTEETSDSSRTDAASHLLPPKDIAWMKLAELKARTFKSLFGS